MDIGYLRLSIAYHLVMSWLCSGYLWLIFFGLSFGYCLLIFGLLPAYLSVMIGIFGAMFGLSIGLCFGYIMGYLAVIFVR